MKKVLGFFTKALLCTLSLLPIHSNAQIIISGYVDGNRYNKAVELYNTSSSPVNLVGWSLRKMINGNTSNWEIFNLSGIIEPNCTYVIAHSDADAFLLLKADTLTYNAVSFNGDDPVAIFQGGVRIDQIGVPGGVLFANRVTYIRKNGAYNTFPTGVDPRNANEWVQYSTNWADGIGVPKVAVKPTGNYNYVKSVRPSIPASTVNQINDFPVGLTGTSITYFDGLGRVNQIVSASQNPKGKDIVQPVDYDEFGRQSKNYLPYEGYNSSTYYQPEWKNAQLGFYSGMYPGENRPFSETVFESSPLNRVDAQLGPGKDWFNNDKKVNYSYSTNASGKVYLFSVNASGALVFNGTYLAGKLFLTEVMDEDNRTVREWKDLLGRVVLKETQLTTTSWAGTYYVYDDFGRLRWVLPPMTFDGFKPLAGWTLSQNDELATKYAYIYEYDERGRLISKILPGKQNECFVYDSRDRLVLSQDGVLRNKVKWRAFVYDDLNRLIRMGIVAVPQSLYTQAQVQQWFNNTAYDLDQRIANGTLLTETFYDSYPASLPLDLAYKTCTILGETMPIKSTRTRGMVTAQRVRVLDRDEVLCESYYYDDKGRTVQVAAQQLYGGVSRSAFKYSWDGKLLRELTRMESANGTNYDGLVKDYAYDHAGRSLGYTVNIEKSSATVVIADRLSAVSHQYDKLGKLKQEVLGLDRNNRKPQQVDYDYNIRGWLAQINNPDAMGTDFFAISLRYANTTASSYRQWGGNIGEMFWRTTAHSNDPGSGDSYGVRHRYRFAYDGLGRLKDAIYAHITSGGNEDNPGRYNEHLTYDKNGNINSLTRWVRDGSVRIKVDEMQYSYTGNQLVNVVNLIDSPRSYPNVNGTNNLAVEFTYDGNGNMTHDDNRAIQVEYNSLNLPKTVSPQSGSDDNIKYIYDALGRKLVTKHTQGVIQDQKVYIGASVYSMANESLTLDYISTSHGRLVNTGSTLEMEYHLKDHLGNVRVAFSVGSNGQPVTKQVNTYYPFGLQIGRLSFDNSSGNRLKYNGKEEQNFALNNRLLGWLDYSFRMYDSQLARFHTLDPLALIFSHQSPFAYAGNDPVRHIDFMGLSPTVGADGLTNEQWIKSSRPDASPDLAKQYLLQNLETERNSRAVHNMAKFLQNASGEDLENSGLSGYYTMKDGVIMKIHVSGFGSWFSSASGRGYPQGQGGGDGVTFAAALGIAAVALSPEWTASASVPVWGQVAMGVATIATAAYIHANSKSSQKPNIVYEIYSFNLAGDYKTMKYGVSSRSDFVTRTGNPRPEYQCVALNSIAPPGVYYWYSILARTPDRASALSIEQSYVRAYQAANGGLRPPLQIKP